MNNFELHEKAETLTAIMSPYKLARELLEYRARYHDLIKDTQHLYRSLNTYEEQLAEYQSIYGSLEQSDYVRRNL